MVCVSASVNLPLHHKVQKFSSGIGSSKWSQNKGRKTVVVVFVPEETFSDKRDRLFMARCPSRHPSIIVKH